MSGVRRLLADLLELAQVRLQLLGLEARDDAGQLLGIALQAILAILLGVFGLVLFALFLTLLLWESHRLLVLGAFTALFAAGAVIAALLARRRWRRGMAWFRASVDELRRDREHLQP